MNDVHEARKSRLVSLAIGFYTGVNLIAKKIYHGFVRNERRYPPEKARENLDSFVRQIVGMRVVKDMARGTRQKKEKRKTLEQELQTFGEHYISRQMLDACPVVELRDFALEYDLKGIVPAPNETLRDFVYRGNTLLFLHRALKKSEIEPEVKIEGKGELTLRADFNGRVVRQFDLEEAVRCIPHYMDLSWVTAYIKEKNKMMAPALGLTFTLQQYDGFNFVQVRSVYKSREQFISVLAHELTHAGTVYLDTSRRYLETKAYAVGKGDLILGEYAVSLNANPPILLRMLKSVCEVILTMPFPEKLFKILPKAKSALEVLVNTQSYNEVRKRLEEQYGKRGGYILGRLNAEEIEEFRDTNDISGRIAMKRSLKWNLMRTNLTRIA